MKKEFPHWLEMVGKVFKWIGIFLAAFIVLILVIVLISRIVNASKTKISTENGVQESAYVDLGGIEQYVEIRGEDSKNPIILVLHGGPGSPMTNISYYYQGGLEDEYTIVNWDQRGCGRTYYANQDLNELVDYLTDRFGQDKVIILGHSWGTVLGSQYAMEHPEKVSAYIGVAQSINFLEGKVLATENSIRLADEDGNKEYVKNLSALSSEVFSAENYDDFDFISYANMCSLILQYPSCKDSMPPLQIMWTGMTSSDLSLSDIYWQKILNFNFERFLKLEYPLLEYYFVGFDIYEHGTEYEVPVYFISGDYDWTTPYPMVEKYYESVKAPDKDMILIKNTNHSPFLDNPDAFCAAVKSVLDDIK